MNVTVNSAFQAKLEELLGERGTKANRAVRFKDLGSAGAGMTEQTAKHVEKIAEKVAREIAESYDSANIDVAALQAQIDAAEAEALAASAAAQNALSAAQNASAHADTIVQQARDDLAVDFQTAINAAGQADTAMLAAQQARDAALQAVTDASGHATAASGFASTASTKATEAGDAATAAASSATTASTKAGEASTSAQQASASKTDAAGSASAAASSATTAANSATTAGQKATAASTSASQASTHATDAGSSAAAANTAKLAAESARDGSITAKGQAEIARNDAVTAKNNAEGAAAGAMSSMNLAAQIAGTGNGLIDDQFLGGSSWIRYQSGGTFSRLPNEVYPIGNTWVFSVQASQSDGLYIRSTDPAWTGDPNPNGLVVEIEYDFPTGNTDGSGVLVAFRAGGVDYNVTKRLRDMDKSPYAYGRRVASGVFIRPSNYSGSFERITVYLMANWSGMHPDPKGKTLRIHRVNVRVATEEEMGSGEVMAAVTAKLSNEYMTAVQTTQAVASGISTYDASIAGGVKATVTQSSTAISNLQGGIAGMKYIVQSGAANAAGIEAVSIDPNNGQKTTSAVVLHGDNVIAPGTLSTNALVVGLGKNLLIDPTFSDGLAHYSFGTTHGGEVRIRQPGELYAHPGYPALEIFQNNGNTAGQSDIITTPVVNEGGSKAPGVPVQPGKIYTASAYFSTLRCNSQLLIQWVNASGTAMPGAFSSGSGTAGGDSSNPDLWPRVTASGVAPAGAAYARLIFRKTGTLSGQSNSYLFIWKPQLEESAFAGQEPSPWSPGGTTFINGGRLFANSITTRELAANSVTAEKILVNDLSAISANLGSIQVGSANISNGAITNAKIGNLQVDRIKIADNAVTIQHQATFDVLAQEITFTFNMPAVGSALLGFSGELSRDNQSWGRAALYINSAVVRFANVFGPPANVLVSENMVPATLMASMPNIGVGNHTITLKTSVNTFISGSKIVGALFAFVRYK